MGEGIPYLHTVHLLFLSCVVYAEVVVLTLLINTYTMYMLLYSVTDWQGTGEQSCNTQRPSLAYPDLVLHCLLILPLKLVKYCESLSDICLFYSTFMTCFVSVLFVFIAFKNWFIQLMVSLALEALGTYHDRNSLRVMGVWCSGLFHLHVCFFVSHQRVLGSRTFCLFVSVIGHLLLV